MGSLLSMILLGSLIVGTIFLIRSGKFPKLSSLSLPSFLKPSSGGSNQGPGGAVLKYSLVIFGLVVATIAIAFVFFPEALKANFSSQVWKAILIAIVAGIVARLAQAKTKMNGLTELGISLAVAVVVGIITFHYLGKRDGIINDVSALCKDQPYVRIKEYGQTFELPVSCSKIIFIRRMDNKKFSEGLYSQIADKKLAADSMEAEWSILTTKFKERKNTSDRQYKITPSPEFIKSGRTTMTFVFTRPGESLDAYPGALGSTPSEDNSEAGVDFLTPAP